MNQIFKAIVRFIDRLDMNDVIGFVYVLALLIISIGVAAYGH